MQQNQTNIVQNSQQQLEKFEFKFWYIPIIGGMAAMMAIIIGYFIALDLGHVEPFPQTDITHTTIHYPEYYFARIGFPTACVFISMSFYILVFFLNKKVQYINLILNQKQEMRQQLQYLQPNTDEYNKIQNKLNSSKYKKVKDIQNNKQAEPITIPQKIIIWLGVIACILFLISISVIQESNMNWVLHIFGATGFFVVIAIDFIIITRTYTKIWGYYPNFVSNFSYTYKHVAIQIFLVVVVLLYLEDKPGYEDYFPKDFGNIAEWGLTAVVLVYIVTLSQDFKNISLQFKEDI